MKVYFVRHGLSVSNQEGVFQDDADQLAEIGKKQAEIVAKRLKDISVDIIISSPLQRAKDTAETINAHLNKPLEYTNLLRENRNPTSLVGKRYHSEEADRIKQEMERHLMEVTWRYSDEENFYDILGRAKAFVEYLATLKEHAVLVITHGMILKMIIAFMMEGECLTPTLFRHIDSFFQMANTGITICETDSDTSWKLVTWNDRAHIV